MHRIKGWVTLALIVTLLMAAAAAAADTFAFSEKSVTLFEGETLKPELKREGLPAEDGELTFKSGAEKIFTVAEDGTITALQKGQAQISATLKNGKKSWRAMMYVNVLRAVTDVTLSTKGLTIYEPDDPEITPLLKEDPGWPVIVLPAGKSVTLSAVCTPENASNRNITYTSSDIGIAKITERTMRGIQAGTCELVVASKQNPEVTETFCVLVTQPITKLEITADSKKLSAGSTMALQVNYTPANATIQQVEWKSRNTKVATVDENGVVTGVGRGNVYIDAKAADGSGRSASFYLTVTQPAQTLTLKNTDVQVVTGRRVTLTPQIGPSNTDDKTVGWFTSDESIATVSKGVVTGVKAGECDITCVSNSNPELTAVAHVSVIQQVTKIEITPEKPDPFPINTTLQLGWTVYPEDASIKDVTFSSSRPKVASVDQNGLVTGLSKGDANITVSATDGSKKKTTIRVRVTQPVEGVSIQYPIYHVQLDRVLGVKALISPFNANNYNMSWYIEDESIATVRPSKNYGNVRGLREGVTTVTGVTEDGGFTASAEIRVADFNGAVIMDEVWVANNKIWVTMRNISDIIMEKVFFHVECFDQAGNPMVCNTDGVSTSFDGVYAHTFYPKERTNPERTSYGNMQITQPLGTVLVHITGWLDNEGYRRNINDVNDQPMLYWTSNLPFNTNGN